MKYKIFVDGGAGTTGLEIVERLKKRDDVSLITLSEENRKSDSARKEALNSADLVFLCLPDDAAVSAVSMIENPSVKVIDASTAHRTKGGWVYGFPEINGLEKEIKKSKRVANPGCHASGFNALIAPLIGENLLSKNANLTCFSLTGYSGGGKKMIAEYEGEKPLSYEAPRQYGLTQNHKHLPEMQKVCGLEVAPVFCPIVADFKRGMQVTVPLFKNQINASVNDLKDFYKKYYTGKVVKFVDSGESFISACSLAGSDGMQISVFGNEDRILLVSTFDNLGKGASGAAIENMNIMLGEDHCKGLVL